MNLVSMDSLTQTASQEVAAALGTTNAFLQLSAPLDPASEGGQNGDEEKER